MFRPVGIVVVCRTRSLLLRGGLGGLGGWLCSWLGLGRLGWLSSLGRWGLGGCLCWGSFLRGHNPWLLKGGQTSGTGFKNLLSLFGTLARKTTRKRDTLSQSGDSSLKLTAHPMRPIVEPFGDCVKRNLLMDNSLSKSTVPQLLKISLHVGDVTCRDTLRRRFL